MNPAAVPDETGRRFHEALRSPLALGLFTLLTIVGGGWVGDTLKGDCLGFGSLRQCAEGALDLPGIGISLVLFALAGAGLLKVSRAYLPVRQLRAHRAERGRQAIVASISTYSKDFSIAADGSRFELKGREPIVVSGRIGDDIERLAAFKCNTQQFLRALRPHIDAGARHVILLGSDDTPRASGSARLRPDYAALLRRYAPQARIDISTPAVDSEDLDAMRETIISVCDRLRDAGLSDSDIMIDVTAGHKTASIAAALATLHRSGLQFQYVATTEPHDVIVFDVVTEAPAKLS